jgi:hypothetical protein
MYIEKYILKNEEMFGQLSSLFHSSAGSRIKGAIRADEKIDTITILVV